MIAQLTALAAFAALALSVWQAGHRSGVGEGKQLGFSEGRAWERESNA